MIDQKYLKFGFKNFHLSIFFNSIGFLFLSYALVRGTLLLFSYFLAKAIGLTYQRTFFDLIYTNSSTSGIWNYSNIITVYLSPTIITGILFILIYILYRTRLKYIKGIHKIFWLWLLFQTLIICMGGIIASVTSEKGSYYALQWMYMPYASMMILSLFCLVALVILGWIIGKNFLYVTESHKLIKSLWLQKKHLFYSLLLPYFTFFLIVFFVQRNSMDKYNVILLVCGFLAIVPILFQNTKIDLTILRHDRLSFISVFAIVGVVLGLLLLLVL